MIGVQRKNTLFWICSILLISLLILLTPSSSTRTYAETTEPSRVSPSPSPPMPLEDSNTPLLNALRQSSDMTSFGFCKELPTSIETPEELQSILTLLSPSNSVKPDILRARITALMSPLREGTQSIDQASRIYQEAKKRSLDFSKLEKPTWFAGGNEKNYRIPKNEPLETFLKRLFFLIPEQSLLWNPTQLSRADLFHAHLIYHRDLRDLILVFHAKEYPRDHPSLCSGCWMKKLFQTFALQLPRSIQSSPPTESYLRRNFLISLARKKLCGVNTQAPLFLKLAQDDGDGSTLDPLKLTDLDQEGLLMDIHFFAHEGAPLFIDLLRES